MPRVVELSGAPELQAEKKPWQITARDKRVIRMGFPDHCPLIGGRTDIALGYSANS